VLIGAVLIGLEAMPEFADAAMAGLHDKSHSSTSLSFGEYTFTRQS
jgi:hypothetical protein